MCKIHQSGQNLAESTCVCLEQQARIKARIVVFRQRWRASGTRMDRGLFLFLLSSVSSSLFPPHPRSTVSTELLCN